MTTVDPFIHPIPRKIQSDPELRPFFEYFVRWAHDMWKRSGGGDDLISDAGTRESYPWVLDETDTYSNIYPMFGSDSQSQDFIKNLYPQDTLEIKSLIRKIISNEIYTSAGDEFIKCKNKSTVKLPLNPSSDCIIYVHNGDGTLLTIDGNGKTINGDKKKFLTQKGSGLQIYYFIEDNEYIAI